MTPVEQLYAALAAKMQCTRQWHQLHPLEQAEFVDAVNVILRIISRGQNA